MNVTATRLFSGSDQGIRKNVMLRHVDGVITEISEAARPEAAPRSLILPAFINAHDHARPRASSFGAVGMPLESWILRTVVGTPVDPYLTAASALARAAQAGCAAMMVHYTRPSGTMPLLDEVKAIGRAAGDVGIRIAFAIAVRDQNPIVYGDSEPVLAGLASDERKTIEELFVRTPMSPKAYIELTDAIAAAIGGPKVDVQLGPAGVQWCSKPLLEAVAENSAQTGRRVHMHLLETIYQRAWADERFPGGIVRYLRDIGLLSERLTLAHCIHARPDEIEMIAASGARIVTNFSSKPASALRPGADRRRARVRLRHRGRRRRPGARRRRRRAARDAAGADDARRPRLQPNVDTAGVFCARDPQWPPRHRCARHRRARRRRAGRFRQHRSRPAGARSDC
ncbi:cytosine/adenosine deaminase-related metal-dependent hydrolase [Bradyrhizobium sp. USDA 4452]